MLFLLRPYSHETFWRTILHKKDKKILRYLRHGFQFPTKVIFYKNTTYLVMCYVKSLPWLFNRNLLNEIKISFHRNIAILCAKMSRVNKALNSDPSLLMIL